MAFNFGAFVGGMSKQIVADIEREEEYELKMKQIAETEAMRQRAARAGERKKEQAALEASIGALKFLGYSDQAAAAIARQGEYAVGLAQNIGEQALEKNVDVNTIYNMPSIDSNLEISGEEMSETVNAVKSDAPKLSTGVIGLNAEAYRNLQNMFVDPDKEELSHNARIAILDQKIARNPNSENVENWQGERKTLLENLAELKKVEKEAEGTTTPSFTIGTIASNLAFFDKTSLPAAGFKLGINDQIENLEEGNLHMQDIASLDTVSKATEFNTAYNDPGMKAAINARRNAAINNLKEYAYDKYYDTAVNTPKYTDPAQVDRDIRTGKLRRGSVYVFENNVYVYTGIEDIVTGNAFYEFSLE